GHRLSLTIRRDIFAATVTLVQYTSGLELFAEPASRARKRINNVQKTANSFLRIVTTNPENYAHRYANMLIEMQFSDERISGYRKLKELAELIESLSASCESAMKRLDDLTVTGPRKGSAWGIWVRQLTDIIQKHELPFGARKDPAKQSQKRPPSPFVALVRELQL